MASYLLLAGRTNDLLISPKVRHIAHSVASGYDGFHFTKCVWSCILSTSKKIQLYNDEIDLSCLPTASLEVDSRMT